MKKWVLTLVACMAWLQANAADGSWTTSLPKALEQAKKENKLVLVDFTGSDWCPPCKALTKNVFGSQKFAEYAKENLVLVEVDTPRSKKLAPDLEKANDALKQRYSIRAFPTIILMNPQAKELGRLEGYGGEKPEEWLAKIDAFKQK
jgi:thioredoxin-related protein